MLKTRKTQRVRDAINILREAEKSLMAALPKDSTVGEIMELGKNVTAAQNELHEALDQLDSDYEDILLELREAQGDV